MEQVDLINNDNKNTEELDEMATAVEEGIEKENGDEKIDVDIGDDIGKENKKEEDTISISDINGKLNINASEFVPRLKHNKDGKPELNLIELQRHFESMDATYKNEIPIIKSVEALERVLIEQTLAENKRKLEAQWKNFPKGLSGLSENTNNATKGTRIVMLNENDYFVTQRLKRPKRERSEPVREKPWDPELKSMYGKRFESDEKRREHERKVALEALKLVEQRRARTFDKKPEAVGKGDGNDVVPIRHISYSPLRMGVEDSDRVHRLRNAKKQRIERVLKEMQNNDANILASKKKSEGTKQEDEATVKVALVSTGSTNVKAEAVNENKNSILKELNRNEGQNAIAKDGVAPHFKAYAPKSINLRNKQQDLGQNTIHPLHLNNDGYRKKPYGSHSIFRSDMPFNDDEKENFYQSAYGGGPSSQQDFRRNIYGRGSGYPNSKYFASNAFTQNKFGEQANFMRAFKNYDMPDGMLPPNANYYNRESGFPYSRSPFTNMRYRGPLRVPNNTPVHQNQKNQHQLRSNSPTAAFFKADNKSKNIHQYYGRQSYNNRYIDNNAESVAAAGHNMPFTRTGPKRTYDMKKMMEIKNEVIKTYAQVAGGGKNGNEGPLNNLTKSGDSKTEDAANPSAASVINDSNDFPALKPKYLQQQLRDPSSKKLLSAIKRYTIEELMKLATTEYQLTPNQSKDLIKLESIRRVNTE